MHHQASTGHHQASTGRRGESKSQTLRTTCCQMLRSLRSERGFSSTSAAPTSMPRHTSSVLLPFSDMSTTGRCEADCLRGPQCLASLATAWACSAEALSMPFVIRHSAARGPSEQDIGDRRSFPGIRRGMRLLHRKYSLESGETFLHFSPILQMAARPIRNAVIAQMNP